MSADFEVTLYVSQAAQRHIEQIMREPKDASEACDRDETHTETVTFENGLQADIKACAVDYDEDEESNAGWTEGVLFDAGGHELVCTEPGEDYYGEYYFEYDGCTYLVNVKKAGEEK